MKLTRRPITDDDIFIAGISITALLCLVAVIMFAPQSFGILVICTSIVGGFVLLCWITAILMTWIIK